MFIVIGKKFILGAFGAIMAVLIVCFTTANFSQKASTDSLDSKTVVIDAGHGGMDGGSVGEDGTPEKNLNLEIAKKLQKLFNDNGYNVVMTREADTSLHENDNASIRNQKNADLRKRAEIANNSKAHLFISVHINKFETPDIMGAQTFYSKDDETGKKYAESIMESLRELQPKNKRLAKTHPNKNLLFQKLEIPGVLVECGFISNKDELYNLKNDEYQMKIAEAIYKGVIN